MDSLTGLFRAPWRKRCEKPGEEDETATNDENLLRGFEYNDFSEINSRTRRASQEIHLLSPRSDTYRGSFVATPRPSVEADDIITGKHSQDFSSPLSQVSYDSQWTSSTDSTTQSSTPGSQRLHSHPHSHPNSHPHSHPHPHPRPHPHLHSHSQSQKVYVPGFGTTDVSVVAEVGGNSLLHHVAPRQSERYDIFGQPLEHAINLDASLVGDQPTIITPICETVLQPLVPLFVRKCVSFLTQYGLEEEGLYRVSGSKVVVKQLQQKFVTDGPTFELDASVDDIHTVASLIKQYLRELPEDLLPVRDDQFSYNNDFAIPDEGPNRLNAPRSQTSKFLPINQALDAGTVCDLIKEDLYNLSPPNFALLHYLMRHLWMVQKYSSQNRMTLANLAVIFSPTLRISRTLLMKLIECGDIPPNYNRAFSTWRRPSIEDAPPSVTKLLPTKNPMRSRAAKHGRMASFDFLSTAATTTTPSSDIY